MVVDTLESTPRSGATHWSRASMAKKSRLSSSTIGRIWHKFELKPHLADTFKLSTDPMFVDKVYDVVGLYLNPPEFAVVYCVDEKSQIQALARSQPAFPLMPGMPEKRTHDYVRHGTSSLFAAFNIADCTVISSLHRRHRAVEFRKFLIKIDKQTPRASTSIWSATTTAPTSPRNPHMACRPCPFPHPLHTHQFRLAQSSRTMVRRADHELLQCGHHTSVQSLERDIRTWSLLGTKIPSRSSGPRPPTTYSPHSHD